MITVLASAEGSPSSVQLPPLAQAQRYSVGVMVDDALCGSVAMIVSVSLSVTTVGL